MIEDEKRIQHLHKKIKDAQLPLDARTQGQLRAARRTAIESLNKPPGFLTKITSVKYALSSIVTLAVVIAIIMPIYNYNLNAPSTVYDYDAVAITEDIELLEELDFYLWIADNIENGQKLLELATALANSLNRLWPESDDEEVLHDLGAIRFHLRAGASTRSSYGSQAERPAFFGSTRRQ